MRLSTTRCDDNICTGNGPNPCHIVIGTGRFPAILAPGLRRDCPVCTKTILTPCHVCTKTGLTRPPRLHRDYFRPCHVCTKTGLASPTSAPGLFPPLATSVSSSLPPTACDATPAPFLLILQTQCGFIGGPSAPGLDSPPCHICAGTGLTPLPHLRQDYSHPRPQLCRDWAYPCHSAPGLRSIPATSAPGLFSLLYWDYTHPLPHLRRDYSQPSLTGTSLTRG